MKSEVICFGIILKLFKGTENKSFIVLDSHTVSSSVKLFWDICVLQYVGNRASAEFVAPIFRVVQEDGTFT